MKTAFVTALIASIFFVSSAQARQYRHLTHRYGHYLAWRHMHHHQHARFAYRHRRQHRDVVHVGSAGVSKMKLDNGSAVVVSASFGDRLVGFLNDLFHQEGRLPEIGCYAAHGHMPLPWGRHPVGEACDVGQRARNVAWEPMYRIGDLARKWGLTDGCWWRGNPDCGHVQVNRAVAYVPAVIAVAIARKPRPLVRYASGTLQ